MLFMTVSGVLIAESILKDRPLDGVKIEVHKVSRGDAGDTTIGQPRTWTFIEFELEDAAVDDLVAALRRSLDPSHGWYCSFRTVEDQFVVFAGCVFRYPLGQAEGQFRAEAYGRSVGVPEAQLDWSE
jgi:hypothetical protein